MANYDRLARTVLVPPLADHLHKGQAGRICIIGGSEEYCGAPFFAAQTALRMGADLAHVVCEQSAAVPIKTYSPELIVHPMLRNRSSFDHTDSFDAIVEPIVKMFPRLHVLVIGPGLGRDTVTLDCVERVINEARKSKIPVVFDGDALHLVTQTPQLVKGHEHAILTPNVNEFKRLCDKMNILHDDANTGSAQALASALDHVTIVRKGHEDVITDGHETAICTRRGGPRRCGGQGDIMAGAIGTYLAWAVKHPLIHLPPSTKPAILAAMAGAMLTRECAHLAYSRCGRATTTTDLLAEVPRAFANLIDEIAPATL